MKIVESAKNLCRSVQRLRFSAPIAYVYNPLDYAWSNHRAYLERYAQGQKYALFLGMNPGPWGMAQTGIPFGEVSIVRDWLGLSAKIGRPPVEHPKRPVDGMQCRRSEVSGRRLWGAIQQHFGDAERFFRRFLVVNYCPLAFLEQSGRNRTPDKLPVAEVEALFEACDRHLRDVVGSAQPTYVIGVGAFAETRAKAALRGSSVRIARVLHPSPASPAANHNWSGKVIDQLRQIGVCSGPAAKR